MFQIDEYDVNELVIFLEMDMTIFSLLIRNENLFFSIIKRGNSHVIL
jgi:hypothetical protein